MYDFLVVLGALVFLMFVAYRGFSVILFAPVAALLAVVLTDPGQVLPMYSSVFLDRMVEFLQLYFPVFLLGAVFGKVIELSGFSRAIVLSIIGIVGRQRAMLSIVVVCAVLTYGGVSLFVVVFAVYPFAAEMFKEVDIPKRLIPGTIALGAFTFTMDALPGTPQIQNIIPTTFFSTTTWAAPILGIVGSVFILFAGLLYLEWRRRTAASAGEGYGEGHINEPEPLSEERLPNALLALSPLVAVFVLNRVFTALIPRFFGDEHQMNLAGVSDPVVTDVTKLVAIWSVTGALLVGVLLTVALSFNLIRKRFAEGTKAAVSGALLASMNTASEYGFGGVIAGLSGFIVISDALRAIPNVLVNEAITVSVLAGVTGSASGGMSIALAAMSDKFIEAANAADVPLEVLHRVASMASGGMDTLPHNGAVITLLAVTGLTHRQAYKDIFAITMVKTLAVFLIIGVYYLTGLY
jgi:H+/gluconate symporter-like permease